MPLGPSELILNADKSIYHLNLLPQDIATTVITVGDPDRVSEVSKHFDSIEIKKGNREFITHTGTLKGQPITVLSTGIGTDNIDIVLNELDALVNVDFKTRTIKEVNSRLQLVRIGTSGAIQEDVAVGDYLLSEYAIGFDSLLHFYESEHIQEHEISTALVEHIQRPIELGIPYVVKCDENLAKKMYSNHIRLAMTATNTGFYGPQSRRLRIQLKSEDFIDKLSAFRFKERAIDNLEMETSGIYGLSKLMGHSAVSLNCILANRVTGEFSANPKKAVDEMIQYALERVLL